MTYNLGIIILSVRDLGQARKFYSEQLGHPVLDQMSNDHFVMVALSNGEVVSDQEHGKTRTTHYRFNFPHSPYLVTLAVADFCALAFYFSIAAAILR